MSLFSDYKTDPALEIDGVVFTPSSTVAITISRGGGANVKFRQAQATAAKPYRRQIQAGTLDPEIERRLDAEICARCIVKNWETLVDGDLVPGIEAAPDSPAGTYTHAPDENGLVPVNFKNVRATLLMLPDLLADIQMNAADAANYREAERENDAKNSRTS